jgi:hypothetical protein
MKKKLPTLSALEKKLDRVFSEYIRRKDADHGGTVDCCTCGKLFYWKEVDAGHFVKRQHRSIRWDERNVHPQCTRCNHFMGGRQDDYAQFVIKKYGQTVFDELMLLKYQTVKYTRADLMDMIELYQEKLSKL